MNKFAGANLFRKFSVKTSNRSNIRLDCNIRAQLRSFMMNNEFTKANLFRKFSVKTSNRSNIRLDCNIQAQLRNFITNNEFTKANSFSSTNTPVCGKGKDPQAQSCSLNQYENGLLAGYEVCLRDAEMSPRLPGINLG